MSNNINNVAFANKLISMSHELERLSKVAIESQPNYMTIDEAFAHIHNQYKTNQLDTELIAMQSELHINTVRKLMANKEAFFNAKFLTIRQLLSTLGIELWAK